MKSLLPLCLLVAICVEFGEAGLAFKAGLVKGALKGLFKGQSGKSEDEQCETRWEEVWKPVCTQHYETQCRNEPQQQCQTEQRQECWTENRQQCSTTHEKVCSTEYQEQCSTEYEEECWTETETECTQETECFDAPPPSTSYSSSSKHKRSVDDDLEISDEELKETLDSMSASDLLELSEELDIQESLAASDGEAGRRLTKSQPPLLPPEQQNFLLQKLLLPKLLEQRLHLWLLHLQLLPLKLVLLLLRPRESR